MDIKLTFSKAHHAGKLSEELVAALPSLIDTVAGVRHARFSFSTKGEAITLWVPTGTDPAVVQAVIDAHDATPPPPVANPRDIARAKIDAALAAKSSPAILDALAAIKAVL